MKKVYIPFIKISKSFLINCINCIKSSNDYGKNTLDYCWYNIVTYK